jgi:hypothetical protein
MEIPLAELQRNLNTVRLHGMSATLETRLVQANQGASFAEVFACLVQDEMDWRNSPKRKSTNSSAANSSGTARMPF